ncbi:isopentenyl-diphosphate Delta-isomerase [Kytococcus schroeteri]|uniref:Isopentenyl-diphosphate Delta-isomerase n=1 Tax=Kytococcus schroeteri TaxID=138300 RepID=A0A2I1PDY5_9MICO|nr:isopentenyl-diphosphate Delta-isomerase [Kytococcus schroeteri]PKZ42824.1 isopentenyl-diphosphate Delta-isomerase [Kytococcus schroeteri]
MTGRAQTETPELVELLAEDGSVIGTADKAEVHTDATPLHRAFSVHLRTPDGRVLLTRRALGKVAWPGVWTNTCCGHPAPGESDEGAIRRRLAQELTIPADAVGAPVPALPDFHYRAVDAGGVVEHEVCPVYVADLLVDPATLPSPNPDEVAETAWAPWTDAVAALRATPFAFSPWFVLQARDPRLNALLT